jgi:hypothetical protein
MQQSTRSRLRGVESPWKLMVRTKGLSKEKFLQELSGRAPHRFVSENLRQVRYQGCSAGRRSTRRSGAAPRANSRLFKTYRPVRIVRRTKQGDYLPEYDAIRAFLC